MPLVLVFPSGRLPLDRDASIGSGAGCALVLAGLAKEHARVRATDERVLLAAVDDAKVRVGGVAIETAAERWLHLGDTVEIEGLSGSVELEDTEVPLRTAELALAIVRRLRSSRVPILHVVEGPDLGAELELAVEGKVHRIGRAASCALVLGDPTASREHVRISRKGTHVFVADMDAPRGTFLGQTRLVPGEDAEWDPRLAMRIGRTVLRLQAPDDADRVDVVARNLVNEVPPPMPAMPAMPAPLIHASPPRRSPPKPWPFVAAAAMLVVGSLGLLYWILR
ncbi:hypothetical protein BH09MYX1_BH09MYX1_13350 [soil metagenome]